MAWDPRRPARWLLAALLTAAAVGSTVFAAALWRLPSEVFWRAQADLLAAAGALAVLPPLAARGGWGHRAAALAVALAGLAVVPRLTADARFVSVLAYYGDPANGPAYAELLPRARRVVAADPAFTFAPLFAAHALAFDVGRPQEALSLLEETAQAVPGDLALAATAGGMAAFGQVDRPRVLALLAPALRRPDCPPGLRRLAAFVARRR